MQLSDLLTIIGLVIAVLAIVVTLYAHISGGKERDFTKSLLQKILIGIEKIARLLEALFSDKQKVHGVQAEKTTSSEDPDRHTKSTQNPPPPEQEKGKSVDGQSTNVPQLHITVNKPWEQNRPTGHVDRSGRAPNNTDTEPTTIIHNPGVCSSSANPEQTGRQLKDPDINPT